MLNINWMIIFSCRIFEQKKKTKKSISIPPLFVVVAECNSHILFFDLIGNKFVYKNVTVYMVCYLKISICLRTLKDDRPIKVNIIRASTESSRMVTLLEVLITSLDSLAMKKCDYYCSSEI